jgi:hypothetical protein
LPAAFRFEGREVEIDRDPASGAVVLRPLRPPVKEWFIQRAARFHQFRQVLPQLGPAITSSAVPSLAAAVDSAGIVPLLLTPAALGALLAAEDPQLDTWLEQGRCAIAALHELEIQRALAALGLPEITSFVQRGLDLCTSLPWTAACNRSLVQLEQHGGEQGQGLNPLQRLLSAQAQVSGAVLVGEL